MASRDTTTAARQGLPPKKRKRTNPKEPASQSAKRVKRQYICASAEESDAASIEALRVVLQLSRRTMARVDERLAALCKLGRGKRDLFVGDFDFILRRSWLVDAMSAMLERCHWLDRGKRMTVLWFAMGLLDYGMLVAREERRDAAFVPSKETAFACLWAAWKYDSDFSPKDLPPGTRFFLREIGETRCTIKSFLKAEREVLRLCDWTTVRYVDLWSACRSLLKATDRIRRTADVEDLLLYLCISAFYIPGLSPAVCPVDLVALVATTLAMETIEPSGDPEAVAFPSSWNEMMRDGAWSMRQFSGHLSVISKPASKAAEKALTVDSGDSTRTATAPLTTTYGEWAKGFSRVVLRRAAKCADAAFADRMTRGYNRWLLASELERR